MKSVAQVREQPREQLGKPRPDGSCRSDLFGGVLWITRRQSQLESEPCEAGRSTPSGRHGSTGGGGNEKPGTAKSYRPVSSTLLADLGARKVQVKLKDGSLRCVNMREADTHRPLMVASEVIDKGHDVIIPKNLMCLSLPSARRSWWKCRDRLSSISRDGWACTASGREHGQRTVAFLLSQQGGWDAKQPKCLWRLCGKELKRWDSTMPGTFASMGPVECVMSFFSKALVWKLESGSSTRKIMFLDASRAHCRADATNEMVVESPTESK